MTSAFDTVRAFEAELCRYTGARYAVTTNSCTMAILLACAWATQKHPCASMVFLPCLTYVGVPMSVHHAGHGIAFKDVDWQGEYLLKAVPEWSSPIWDSARRFRAGMFRPGSMQCLSFHASKILGASQGGAILHDDEQADAWLRRARFDGRGEGIPAVEDVFQFPAWHCYMSPDTAAQLLWKLTSAEFRRDNPDLPNPEYPDLSKQDAFKPYLAGDDRTHVYAKYKIHSYSPDDEIIVGMRDEGSDASRSEQS